MTTCFLVGDGSGWRIPAYAQDMLWLLSGEQTLQATGPRGMFALDPACWTASPLFLRWGRPDGPELASWRLGESATSVWGWQGGVAISGFIERLHALENRGLDLVVAEIEGQTLAVDHVRLPTLASMRAAPFRRLAETDASDSATATYTVIALADSGMADYLHHALVSELAVECFTTLAPQAGCWHELVGLPLLLESVSLLAPYRGT